MAPKIFFWKLKDNFAYVASLLTWSMMWHFGSTWHPKVMPCHPLGHTDPAPSAFIIFLLSLSSFLSYSGKLAHLYRLPNWHTFDIKWKMGPILFARSPRGAPSLIAWIGGSHPTPLSRRTNLFFPPIQPWRSREINSGEAWSHRQHVQGLTPPLRCDARTCTLPRSNDRD